MNVDPLKHITNMDFLNVSLRNQSMLENRQPGGIGIGRDVFLVDKTVSPIWLMKRCSEVVTEPNIMSQGLFSSQGVPRALSPRFLLHIY